MSVTGSLAKQGEEPGSHHKLFLEDENENFMC